MTDLKAFVRNQPRTCLLLGLLALAAVALVAACGDDDDDGGDAAAATTAPTEAAEPTATSEPEPTATTEPEPTATTEPEPTATAIPTEKPPAPGYPRDVVDLLGRTVTIPDKPVAIVAISPTATELVYAVGGVVIGRSESVDFPPEAVGLPSIGTAYQPSFEAILALEPDLIVADSVIHVQPNIFGPLEELGVPVVFAGAESLDDVVAALTVLGEVLDGEETAAAVIAEIEAARTAAQEALAGIEISAVVLIGDRDRNLYGAKASSYAGDILSALGLTNPADAQPDSGPFPGYTRIAPEKMLQYDPTYIFTVTPAPPPAPRLSGLLGFFPGFNGLQAIENDHVFELPVQLFLQAPGPRAAEAFAAIVAAIVGN